MPNRIVAASSVALMGAGSLLAATPAAAYTSADCGTVPDGAFVSLINDNICSVTFNADSDTEWEVPAGIDRLAAVLVGSGGGGTSIAGCGYGGGGGEVIYIDDVDPADLTDLSVGESSLTNPDGHGYPTSFGPYEAAGGFVGDDNSNAGWSGNGNISAYEGSNNHGGGAKGDATSTGPGEGYMLHDPELTLDDPLFPDTGSTTQWGRGGSGTETPGVNGYGTGGNSDGAAGTQGAAIFRWSLDDMNTDADDSEPLASTGIDANGIGLTAGVLGLGGVGLAAIAAARRALRAN